MNYADTGSMAIDASGRGVLLGLTAEETRFVLACSAKRAGALSQRDSQRLAGLIARHERARLRGMGVPHGAVKNEVRQG